MYGREETEIVHSYRTEYLRRGGASVLCNMQMQMQAEQKSRRRDERSSDGADGVSEDTDNAMSNGEWRERTENRDTTLQVCKEERTT
ncbi:uncharacterized protein ColSpa_05461 [Colletotrichum spaethianum]|uniref:Uncharacterized protein n=1 Tax=Colletotrichum spaethianum TaxID=700344 RepID=A0AA37LG19_9PEZI|nr:uncharacterized protein ColSpa_05461 [Colletotrichum spaethianum]GKT45280.1 hypothetical protein ColSpa_05461 [Colletotrichum spaethianum]